MPSHLTHRVFRSLLANEPIIHRGCLYRRTYSTSSSRAITQTVRSRRLNLQYGRTQQSRSFFRLDILSQGPKKPEVDMDPGVEMMHRYARKKRLNARLPTPEMMATAFRELFEAKKKDKQSIPDVYASLSNNCVQYCLFAAERRRKEGGDTNELLSMKDIMTAAEVLCLTPHPPSKEHVGLMQSLYDMAIAAKDSKATAVCLQPYAAFLCASGQGEKALTLLKKLEKENPGIWSKGEKRAIENTGSTPTAAAASITSDIAQMRNQLALVWINLLRGFRRDANDKNFHEVLNMIEARHPSPTHRLTVAREALAFYMTTNNIAKVKNWWTEFHKRFQAAVDYQSQVDMDEVLGAQTSEVLLWCLQNNELNLGHEVVRNLMSGNPPKTVWDAVFVWAVGTGKGPDEIDRMLGVMEKANSSISDPSRWRLPDSTTINSLVEYAVSKKDPYMAERFITIGRDRKIEPDSRTYVLQIDYRLSINDVDGALIAYKNLQNIGSSSNDDHAAINRLIVALCNSKRHDFDTIMNVTSDLSDRRARFEPPTVLALALLHLRRGEKDDVVDLLNTHAFQYSSTERDSIRDALMDAIRDRQTPTVQAWDAYNLINSIFDETPREQRTQIMTAFFDRRRGDMAAKVFLHMRQHSRENSIPTVPTYIAAFMGITKVRDAETLDVIHNQLKLDFNVDSTTALLNSLMIAYIACDDPRRALDFWDEITATHEGPSYQTLHIVLRACEKAPFGDLRAKEIWAQLRKHGVDVDNALWASYVAALAGNGDNALAIATLETAFETGEAEIDSFILASLYMAAPNGTKQEEIAEWAKETFPRLWADVEKMGFKEAGKWSDVKVVVGIDRSLSP